MFDLPKVNEARRRKGRPLLTREQATAAGGSAPADIEHQPVFDFSLITSSAFNSPGHGAGHESGPGTPAVLLTATAAAPALTVGAVGWTAAAVRSRPIARELMTGIPAYWGSGRGYSDFAGFPVLPA